MTNYRFQHSSDAKISVMKMYYKRKILNNLGIAKLYE